MAVRNINYVALKVVSNFVCGNFEGFTVFVQCVCSVSASNAWYW